MSGLLGRMVPTVRRAQLVLSVFVEWMVIAAKSVFVELQVEPVQLAPLAFEARLVQKASLANQGVWAFVETPVHKVPKATRALKVHAARQALLALTERTAKMAPMVRLGLVAILACRGFAVWRVHLVPKG